MRYKGGERSEVRASETCISIGSELPAAQDAKQHDHEDRQGCGSIPPAGLAAAASARLAVAAAVPGPISPRVDAPVFGAAVFGAAFPAYAGAREAVAVGVTEVALGAVLAVVAGGVRGERRVGALLVGAGGAGGGLAFGGDGAIGVLGADWDVLDGAQVPA